VANYYWLKDENTGNTLVLDQSVIGVNIPAMNRNYTANQTYTDGATITGTGSLSAGVIMLSKRFNHGTYATAWNALMYAFKTWFGQPKANILWFYIFDGSITVRVQIYPVSKGAENYTTLYTSGPVSFGLQMVTAYFQNVSAASTSATIASNAMQTINVTNNGEIRTPPVIQIVNTNAFYLFQVQTSTNYGFRLEGTFAAGSTLIFDCKTGVFTLNGVVVRGYQTGGSIFALDPGLNVLQIFGTATGVNGLTISWNERYF
jgi:hypothetical protein